MCCMARTLVTCGLQYIGLYTYCSFSATLKELYGIFVEFKDEGAGVSLTPQP